MKKKSKGSKAAAILGSLGGAATAKRRTAEERRESARRAAQARWEKIEDKKIEDLVYQKSTPRWAAAQKENKGQ